MDPGDHFKVSAFLSAGKPLIEKLDIFQFSPVFGFFT